MEKIEYLFCVKLNYQTEYIIFFNKKTKLHARMTNIKKTFHKFHKLDPTIKTLKRTSNSS